MGFNAHRRNETRHPAFKRGICLNQLSPLASVRISCRLAGRVSADGCELWPLDDRLSFPYLDSAWETKTPSHTCKLVLVALSDHANSDGICWPSVARLAHRCDISRRTVQRALRELEKAALITITKKVGTSSSYKLNLRIVVIPPASVLRLPCATLTPKPSVTTIKPKRRSLARALMGEAPKSTKTPQEIESLIRDSKAALFRTL